MGWYALDRLYYVLSSCSGIQADQTSRRYTLITIGAISLAFTFIRIFIFKLPETPRYLLSQGKDQAAVDAVNYVARQNGKEEPLTIGMFREIDARLGGGNVSGDTAGESTGAGPGLSTREILRENMKDFKGEHYQALFATRSLALHTVIIWAVWLTIGTSIFHLLFLKFY